MTLPEPIRYSLSGALSLLAHVLFVLIFVITINATHEEPELSDELPDYEIDFIEFEAKQIEPDKAQGEPEPEPEPAEDPPGKEDAAPPPVELPEDPEAEKSAPEPEPEP